MYRGTVGRRQRPDTVGHADDRPRVWSVVVDGSLVDQPAGIRCPGAAGRAGADLVILPLLFPLAAVAPPLRASIR
jgi:hypothetical protein